MQSPDHTLEGSLSFGGKMADRFSKDGGILEFEKLLEPMFTHGMKKRYVGKVVWPEASDDLLVRGYEIRRSDSFDLQSDLLTGLFEKILAEENAEALETVRRTVQSTLRGEVPLGSLVISRTCKGLDAYENPERMANVQAARKMVERGYEFIPGMKVSWIVTDGSSTPQKVEPYVSGTPFVGRPDYRYYAERIAQTASRITEVFGWTEKDLMTGNQQADLFSFAPKDRGNRPKKTAPSKKKTTLDDFFRYRPG
jgi:DNA polymerase I